MSDRDDERKRRRRRALICALLLTLLFAGMVSNNRIPRPVNRKSPERTVEGASMALLTNEDGRKGVLVSVVGRVPSSSPRRGLSAASRKVAVATTVADTTTVAGTAPPPSAPPPDAVPIATRPAPYRWRGFHVGINAGPVIGNSALRTTVDSGSPGMYFLPGDIAQIDGIGGVRATPAGFTGGVQAGYDYQAGAVVYGLEADFDALELHDSRTVTEIYKTDGVTSFTLGQSFRTDWLFTLRPRIGWATGHYLIFGTAGVAATRLKYAETFTDNFNPAFETDSYSKTMIGWTVGGGAEYVLCDHWTFKGEYLYAAFGTMSKDPALVVGPNRDEFDTSVSLTAHLLRFGLNYRF